MTAGVGAQPITQVRPLPISATVTRLVPLVLALVVFGVASWAVKPYPVGIFHDDGVYLILGKALATGKGYRYLHLPGAPLATHYPPIYPALLALLWKLAPSFPRNIALLLLANAVLLALASWALLRFTRDWLRWPLWAAAAVALVGTISLPMILLSTLVMSEVLCIAVAVPLIFATERALADREGRALPLAALGTCAGLLALVRSQAAALTVGVLLLLLVRRKWSRAAWYALGAAVVVLPWQLWVWLHDAALAGPLHGSYGSYAGWLADGLSQGGASFVWRTISINTVESLSLLADRIAPWPSGWLRIVPLLIGLLLIAAGVVRLRRRAPVMLAFLGIYLAATLAWPYAPWRFVWAIWPLVVIVLGEGAWEAFSLSRDNAGVALRPIALACVSVVSLGVARAEIESYTQRAWRAPVQVAQHQIAPLVRWAAMQTAPNDLLLADDEPLVYLMTGRRALPPASFTALEYVRPAASSDSAGVRTLRTLLERYPARYVLTVVPPTRDAARAIMSAPAVHPSLREIQGLGSGGAAFEVVR